MRIALFSTLLICWILFPDYSRLCTTLYRMNSQFTQYLSWNAVSLTRCIVRVYITTLPRRPRFLKNPYKRPARKKKKKLFHRPSIVRPLSLPALYPFTFSRRKDTFPSILPFSLMVLPRPGHFLTDYCTKMANARRPLTRAVICYL